MPIVDVSGLTLATSELRSKVQIRKKIKAFFAERLNINESETTVAFIPDKTIDENEYVVARLYSRSFFGMDEKDLDSICDGIVDILEIAGHPFNEAFSMSIKTIRGRENRQLAMATQKDELPDDGHNFFCGVECGPRDPNR